ncbi:tripartite motif-containing protein 2-like isoform X2 [Dreissena polymorpha]|nr:tripartite motif-containing protein 2-like isoform X2 [Dreissena polymorpha]XP_052276950.1 tripartite motif-containing protein 2-like isoform X2 [Dreissena polymorpha]XP_052276952.1 tripartite motif-containing protein 2-like isoform X2 [Dreissena polymorpha]
MELQNSINNNNNFAFLQPHCGNHQLLNCGICHHRYSNPKLLPCLHSFCEQCLYKYIPEQSLSVTCPVCGQQSILPLDGVAALQANIFINSIMDEHDKALPETCSSSHSNGHDDHTLVTPPIESTQLSNQDASSRLVCTNHKGNSLEFFCTACDTGICSECTTSEHAGHTVAPLSEAIEEHRSSLSDLILGAKEQIPLLQEAINSITEITQSLVSQNEVAEAKVTETFDEIVKLMNERKETLLKDLNQLYNKKHEVLTTQKENLENVISRINTCCAFTEDTLSSGSDSEILLVKKEMCHKLHDLSTNLIRKEPEENEFISFDNSQCQGLKKSIGNMGYIRNNSAVAFNSVATGEGLRHAVVNKPAIIAITTKDRKGDLVKIGQSVIDSELTASNGDRIIPAITDQQNGTYELVYLLPREDNYNMYIKLFGRHIKGSPFKVKAVNACIDGQQDTASNTSKIPRTVAVKQKGTKRPSSSRSGSNRKSHLIEDDLLWKAGVKGRNKGEFTNPQGVCCTESRILVADSNNQVAQVFTFSGECKLKFGSAGRVAGKLQRPTGVAATLNGNFLVADYDNKWINIFAPDGRYLNKIGTGKLLGPKGIAVDKNGHIVVVDNKASAVFIFQPNGKLVTKFGSRGNSESQFAGPHYVAVNAVNDIIVSDFHNHCIKVFDCEGTFLFGFGSNGEGNGQFNAPTGVAVDEYGNILVADWGNSRIQVFDSNGSFLSYVNTSADPLYGPQGLAVSPEGTVVVADSGNHCIKVYKYLQ